VPRELLTTNAFLRTKNGTTTALCKQSTEKGALMPSFACFSMRIKNPKSYFIFYEHFLKIAAGQTNWKENIDNRANGNREPFTTAAVEAFTLLCLENNEQDWLHEAKIIKGKE
jgi:hypothetical protein